MISNDKHFWRAVSHLRECDGRYFTPAQVTLVLERARNARSRAAWAFFRILISKRRKHESNPFSSDPVASRCHRL